MKIEIKRVGQMEVGAGKKRPAYRWVDAYAIVVNGRERQPWMTKSAAQREMRALLRYATRPR